MFKRSIRLASILLVIVLFLSLVPSPAQAVNGGSTYEDYPSGSTFRTETISAGTAHACAVESDGTLNCWGWNDDGQTTPNSYTKIFTQVASGRLHSCAIRENGTVDCWGDNTYNQLYPDYEDTVYLQISAGEYFTCGIVEDGSISCWGDDTYEQITNAPSSGVWTQVDAGYRHACAIDSAGAITCWGDNSDNKASPPSDYIFYQVSGGKNHTCALRYDGIIECWGSNADGQAPALVDDTGYTQVASGGLHTCAIRENGAVNCWGNDTYNQTGEMTSEYSTQITSGDYFSCAILASGEVECWGRDDHDQLALPSDLTSLGTAQISVGGWASCLINPDGSLKCWGDTSYAPTAKMINDTPTGGVFTQVSSQTAVACAIRDNGSLVCWGAYTADEPGPFVQVSAHAEHACAVRPWGGVKCWGNNDHGEATPPAGVQFRQVAAGMGFTCGIKRDNTLECWGLNGNGQTNHPTTGTFKQLSSGEYFSCAVNTAGHLQCWGWSSGGNLTAPGGTFKQVSSWGGHSCALRTNNTVACWGLFGYPDAPPAGVLFRQLSDAGYSGCGITTAGSLACWGRNDHGQAPYAAISPDTLSRPTAGYAYSQQLTFSGGGDSYTTALYSGTLPPGLSINATIGVIAGTPTAAAGGNTYTFTVRARYTQALTGMPVDSFKTYTTKVNRAPVAAPQTVTLNEDTTTVITLTATDGDGDALTYAIASNPAHGTLSGTLPALTYDPNDNFNGADYFDFTVSDGIITTGGIRVSLTVNPVEDNPTASGQSPSTNEDTPKAITLVASDPDGDALTWHVVNPSHGTLTGTPPALTYTPHDNWSGADSFTFYVTDTKSHNSNTATVNITVNPVNDPPTTMNTAVWTDEDTPKAINLPGMDVDSPSVTFTITANPAHGTISGTLPAITYTPHANWNGKDTFTFQVSDGALSTSAWVEVNVNPVNDAPIPPAQGGVTWQISKPYTLVIPAFTDVDSTGLTYTARQQGGGALPAWLTFNAATRTFSGTPPASSVGSYVLQVTASDGSKTGTLTFTLKVVREIKVYLPLLSK